MPRVQADDWRVFMPTFGEFDVGLWHLGRGHRVTSVETEMGSSPLMLCVGYHSNGPAGLWGPWDSDPGPARTTTPCPSQWGQFLSPPHPHKSGFGFSPCCPLG